MIIEMERVLNTKIKVREGDELYYEDGVVLKFTTLKDEFRYADIARIKEGKYKGLGHPLLKFFMREMLKHGIIGIGIRKDSQFKKMIRRFNKSFDLYKKLELDGIKVYYYRRC